MGLRIPRWKARKPYRSRHCLAGRLRLGGRRAKRLRHVEAAIVGETDRMNRSQNSNPTILVICLHFTESKKRDSKRPREPGTKSSFQSCRALRITGHGWPDRGASAPGRFGADVSCHCGGHARARARSAPSPGRGAPWSTAAPGMARGSARRAAFPRKNVMGHSVPWHNALFIISRSEMAAIARDA